jgi:hypothetical protein
MRFRYFTGLFALGLFNLLLVSIFLTTPGYMDADYYLANGLQLVNGHGFIAPFIWNYLADPQGLPAPSHSYWMPLTSLLAAAGMLLTGSETFTAARFPFILMAAVIPPLTAALSYSLYPRRNLAILAGILAAISGFYLPFLTTTSTFTPYMFLGALYFLLAARLLNITASEKSITNPKRGSRLLFALGIVAGMMYLTRTDGLFYLLIAVVAALIHYSRIIYQPITPIKHHANQTVYRSSLITDNLSLKIMQSRIAPFLTSTFLLLMGFLIPTTPWFIRNLITFSFPFPPGTSHTLWLTNYDELFSYPVSFLTFDYWWSSGISNILNDRLYSIWINSVRTFTVQGMIFLLPLILIAFWQMRKSPVVRLGAFTYLISLVVMTLAFPLPSARGGFFHAGAAFQPLFWALGPIGLDAFVSWGARRRGWIPGQAVLVFSVGLVILAMLVTGMTTIPRMLPDDYGNASWDQDHAAYLRLENALIATGAQQHDIVMVNNPPGYYLVSRRPAIVIPNGDLSTTLAAAARFDARYLLLDHNRPQGLADLYLQPSNQPGLQYLTSFESAHIFEIMEE